MKIASFCYETTMSPEKEETTVLLNFGRQYPAVTNAMNTLICHHDDDDVKNEKR